MGPRVWSEGCRFRGLVARFRVWLRLRVEGVGRRVQGVVCRG